MLDNKMPGTVWTVWFILNAEMTHPPEALNEFMLLS